MGERRMRWHSLGAMLASRGGIWLVAVGISHATLPRTEAAEASAQAATQTATNAVSIVIPKSVFIPDKEKGRDPFYPKIGWPGKNATTPDPGPTPVSLEEQVNRLVVLRGITGQEGNRVALINNQTFKLGDSNDVRIGSGDAKLKVTLVRILDRSVVFKVEGSEREFEKSLSE